jgi:hypothetical protein
MLPLEEETLDGMSSPFHAFDSGPESPQKASIRLIRDLTLREPSASRDIGSENTPGCERPVVMIYWDALDRERRFCARHFTF